MEQQAEPRERYEPMVKDPDDPRLIQAAEESGLAAEYADDPALLRFYMRRLLTRGWAGQMTATESRYTSMARRACGKGMSEEQLERLRQGRIRAANQTPPAAL